MKFRKSTPNEEIQFNPTTYYSGTKPPKPLQRPKRRILKKVLLVLAVFVIGVGLYFAYTIFIAGSKIFNGNPFALLTPEKPLQTDEYGRSNILLFGTSEDDPGHPGAELTDSIMIISVDQSKKNAFMVSIPRDLQVAYGRSCTSGTRGKINDVYQCAKNIAGANEQEAQAALRDKAGEVIGLEVPYSVHVNYSALKQLVDAVGGITVMIESDNPNGIYERYVKLPNGPATLNGEAALALARARNAEGGYGLSRSNFDREQYQQKILIALKDKATSVGTLANPIAVNSLINALGNNVRTNFGADEIKTLAKLGRTIDSNHITRLDLNTEDTNLLGADGNPVAGEYNYQAIQRYVRGWAAGDASAAEKPTIAVYNASGQAGAAQVKADALKAEGFTVLAVSNTSGSFAGIQLFDQSQGKKPQSLAKLQKSLQSTVTVGAPPAITTVADFVVIIGTP